MKSARYLPVLALVVLALIWGYSWVPFKLGVHESSPFVFSAMRTLPGALVMLALMAVLHRPLKPKAVGLTMLLGLLQTSGFLGLTNAALVSGGAGRISILANTWQFWILLMAWPILGEKVRGLQWLSVALALGGLVLIIEPWNLHGVRASLLALAGAVSWAASSMVAKVIRKRHQVDLLSLTSWQMLFGSIPLLLLAIFVDAKVPHWSGTFMWSLGFALIVSTCVGSFLWLYALRELPAGIAGLGTLGTPVVGLLMSWAQLGEQPTVLEVIGMVAILAGMAILFARGFNKAAETPPGAAQVGLSQPRRYR